MNSELKNIEAYEIWKEWAGLKGDIRELESMGDQSEETRKTIIAWKNELKMLEKKFEEVNK